MNKTAFEPCYGRESSVECFLFLFFVFFWQELGVRRVSSPCCDRRTCISRYTRGSSRWRRHLPSGFVWGFVGPVTPSLLSWELAAHRSSHASILQPEPGCSSAGGLFKSRCSVNPSYQASLRMRRHYVFLHMRTRHYVVYRRNLSYQLFWANAVST